MATLREKRSGVWEVRVFTGSDARGRPTQLSRTVHGGKRDALKLAAELEVGPAVRRQRVALSATCSMRGSSRTWTRGHPHRRDQQSRVRAIKKDQISRPPLARLSVGDVERWHTRMRKAGMADAGIKNLSGCDARRAVASNNVAGIARLKSSKTQQRSVMTLDDVRAVMMAAATIDPAAIAALRIAAVAGARRAELAALQWTDVIDDQLTIDSAIEFVKRGDGSPEMRDAATKTANTRTLTLDPDTLVLIEAVRVQRQPYGPWMFGLGPELVSPDRIGWWWRRSRKLSGIDAKWRLHGLRHWSATVAIGQGHDVGTAAGGPKPAHQAFMTK